MARHRAKKSGKGSAGQNRKSSESFIEKYLHKEDVVTLPSGLHYRIVEQDESAARPSEFDTVTVHQRILLADGSVIADTYRDGQPEVFTIEEAIEGLKEGLPLMPVGSRFEFVLPPELAWGRKGNRSKIGPNAVLFFDIRLISTK